MIHHPFPMPRDSWYAFDDGFGMQPFSFEMPSEPDHLNRSETFPLAVLDPSVRERLDKAEPAELYRET